MREPERDADLDAIALLRAHGEVEGAALSSYRKLVEQCDNEGVKYLVQLIIEDETRHHRMIGEMLNQLHSVVWEVEVPNRVPAMSGSPDTALTDATRKLIEMEKADGAELVRLRSAVESGGATSLLPLLVNLMIHDTAKHIAILEFILRAQRG
jgi:rubrerythrin